MCCLPWNVVSHLNKIKLKNNDIRLNSYIVVFHKTTVKISNTTDLSCIP